MHPFCIHEPLVRWGSMLACVRPPATVGLYVRTSRLLQVVQSRTFGSAAKQGGVGVRMLMPLLDMLNHGGDEKAGTRHGHIATDSVRWALCARVAWSVGAERTDMQRSLSAALLLVPTIVSDVSSVLRSQAAAQVGHGAAGACGCRGVGDAAQRHPRH
jgi:hypothetical protein